MTPGEDGSDGRMAKRVAELTKKLAMHKAKIGDLISRKDMPSLQFRIISESSKSWKGSWLVEFLGKVAWLGHKRTANLLVFKDDDRWQVIKVHKTL